jgi:DNA-binding response OmpR family regulator
MPSTEHSGGRHRATAGPLQGWRVLVVEDGWQLADTLRLVLERMGMVVAGPVATAKEAEALARECRPDVAVVDVNLNGEMAYALMDWLHGQGTRVIVISGYEELPRSLGRFCATLHKPFTASALQAALRAATAPAA